MTYDEQAELLRSRGYISEVFYYGIGGGEDESDMIIFKKDDHALYFDFTRKMWRKIHQVHLAYETGYPSDYLSEPFYFASL